jgi:hypothetical protein
MSRLIGFAFLIVGSITIILWIVSSYIQPLLPRTINSNIILTFGILLAVLGALGNLKDIIELIERISSTSPQSPLIIYIEKAWVKYLAPGIYSYQIVFRFLAPNNNIFLRQLRLKGIEHLGFVSPDSLFGTNGLDIKAIYPFSDEDYLSALPNEFETKIETLEKNTFLVRDLQITQQSVLSASLVGYINSFRYSDEWADLPTEKWELRVTLGDDKIVTKIFSFSIHPTNPTYSIRSAYTGFYKAVVNLYDSFR